MSRIAWLRLLPPLTGLVSVVLGVGGAGGCSLDWEVRPALGDGAAPTDTGPLDDAAPTDGGADAPLLEDGGVDTDAQCTDLVAATETARVKARDCTLGTSPTECSTTVKDACDCDVVVNASSTSLVTDYQNAIASQIGTCGKPDCSAACKPTGNPTTWSCLQSGTPRPQCYP